MQEIEINAYDISTYVSSYVLIGQCPNHINHKIKTLSLIDDIVLSDIHFPGTSISKTDWNLPISMPRHYFNHIKSSWEEYFDVIYGSLGYKNYTIDLFWFQQYYTNDTHPWHGHGKCNLSSIYYLELPDRSLETEFIDPITKKIFKYEVQEGDIITFPSLLIHRSPINLTANRKTIIAVNSSINDVLPDIETI